MMNRKKLKKYLGKTLCFTGRLNKVKNKTHYIITNIKLNGKLITDHIWVNIPKMDIKLINKEISFKGTIKTYTDNKGVRKLGIKSTHQFNLNTNYQIDLDLKHDKVRHSL